MLSKTLSTSSSTLRTSSGSSTPELYKPLKNRSTDARQRLWPSTSKPERYNRRRYDRPFQYSDPSDSPQIVKTIDLSGLVSSTSRLQYLVVDYSTDGRISVFVSDAAARAILVYDVNAGRGFRLVLPNAVTLGSCRRDVLYLALLRRADGTSCLVFTYLSSTRVFTIRTEYLRKGSSAGKIHDLGAKPAPIVILGTDNGPALFFRYEGRSEIYRWDSANCFKAENFQLVYQGSECQLATHVVADYKRGRMRVLESNFPDYVQGTVGCGANQALTIMQGVQSCV